MNEWRNVGIRKRKNMKKEGKGQTDGTCWAHIKYTEESKRASGKETRPAVDFKWRGVKPVGQRQQE